MSSGPGEEPDHAPPHNQLRVGVIFAGSDSETIRPTFKRVNGMLTGRMRLT